jgi:hypothetical protein
VGPDVVVVVPPVIEAAARIDQVDKPGLVEALVADGAVLCTKRRADGSLNGPVNIRAACTSRETQLDPGALGLQGPKGDPGTAGTTAAVRDATGAFVGALESLGASTVGGDTSLCVVRTLGGAEVRFLVGSDGVHQTPPGPNQAHTYLYFVNDGCTGTPYVDVAEGPTFVTTATALGSVLYVANGAPLTLTYEASAVFRASEADCAHDGGTFQAPHLCCLSAGPPGVAGAAPAAVFDLSTLQAPFHIEAGP